MSAGFAESTVEEAALAWLDRCGFAIAHGPEIAIGQPGAERSDPTYRDVVLEWRLREALVRLNPELPPEALDDAFRKIVRADGPSLIERNRAVHRMLVDGVTVEYRRPDGSIAGAQARVIDFEEPDKDDYLAVNQFTVVGPQGQARRADIVTFVNGLPLGVIELKNPADENATIWSAFRQLQTYGAQIPALFDYNCALVVSDGTEARIGVLGAGKEWFKPWRTIDGATGKRDLPVRAQWPRPWPLVAESATTRSISSSSTSSSSSSSSSSSCSSRSSSSTTSSGSSSSRFRCGLRSLTGRAPKAAQSRC